MTNPANWRSSGRRFWRTTRQAREEATEILGDHPDIIAEFTVEHRAMVANAVFLGSINSFKVMAKLGFDLSWENDWGGTALHLAAWFGKVEMVRELIQLGAPINARDSKYGSSPLAWAGHGSSNSHSADEDYCAVIQFADRRRLNTGGRHQQME